jgi:hypothetical protein
MKQSKSFLNSVESQLLPRLKFMGYLLLGLAALTLVFSMVISLTDLFTPEEFSIVPEMEISSILDLFNDSENNPNPFEVLNFYVISTIFAAVGLTCLWIAKKKKKHLQIKNG